MTLESLFNIPWLLYLVGQWWMFALIGSMIVLGVLIGALNDKAALKLLANKGVGFFTLFVTLASVPLTSRQPLFGVVLGAALSYTIVTFLLKKYQQRVIASDNFGKFLLVSVGAICFIVFLMPLMSLDELGWIVASAVFCLCGYLAYHMHQVSTKKSKKSVQVQPAAPQDDAAHS